MPQPAKASKSKKLLPAADRPLTDGWGSNLISTWEGMYEQSTTQDNVPDPFRKRDKIPRGSIDVRTIGSQRVNPASPGVSQVEKRAGWDWEETPVPTLRKAAKPPPSPSSSSASSGRKYNRNGASRSRSPSRNAATTPNRSPAPSGKPRGSKRNEKERAFVAQTLANLDVSRSTSSLPTPKSTPERRPRRNRSITDPDTRSLAASSDFIFMDTASDVGTVVYVANPRRKTVKKLTTTQLDGERTVSKTSLSSRQASLRQNGNGADQRVRFNALEPVRPGSFLPRIDVSDRILAGIPHRDAPYSPTDDLDKAASAKSKKQKSAGCRCTIM
ncbi:hypothetical protein HDU86_004372 [Geranomyces michiganensis]|nr:hypothetical protein HDU86_004372 [Geranomyces michiganensis]